MTEARALARPAAALRELAGEYWTWRAAEQPRTDDDIPRIRRPEGWKPDWSLDAVGRYLAAVSGFERAWRSLPVPDPASGDPAVRAYVVDHALVGSAIARARFELTTTRQWRHDPGFYVDQSIGVVFDLLRPPGAFDERRTRRVIEALAHVPVALNQGRDNLEGHAQTEPTHLAAQTLATAGGVGAGAAVEQAVGALAQRVPASQRDELVEAGRIAAQELDAYRQWMTEDLATSPWKPIGRSGFEQFLRAVALNPATPDELIHTGSLGEARAEAFSVISSRGHRADSGRSEPRAPLPADVAEICERQHAQEAEIRRFYEERDLLSQPDNLRHYRLVPMPDYIAPLQWLGVTDDIAWEDALERDAVSYQPAGPELGFFDDAIARDPMTGLIHEGCHCQQMALSAMNDDPIRRHYYDSGANEGIAYYNEEMLAGAGLFDGNPDSRETIQAFLRLRTLRVSVDINLALGRLSIEDAALELAERVPMDRPTARWEAAFFAKTPGQGMTYEVGKSQILAFLAQSARRAGFSLRAFHDRLWRNGNVPIALQRYEVLGASDELGRIVV